MKIDDEVLIRILPRPDLRQKNNSSEGSHYANPVSYILGADSSVEHNKGLHFCHEGEVPVGGHRCG